jgi:hypothetical protein
MSRHRAVVSEPRIASAAIAAFGASLAQVIITGVFRAIHANFLRGAAANRTNKNT